MTGYVASCLLYAAIIIRHIFVQYNNYDKRYGAEPLYERWVYTALLPILVLMFFFCSVGGESVNIRELVKFCDLLLIITVMGTGIWSQVVQMDFSKGMQTPRRYAYTMGRQLFVQVGSYRSLTLILQQVLPPSGQRETYGRAAYKRESCNNYQT